MTILGLATQRDTRLVFGLLTRNSRHVPWFAIRCNNCLLYSRHINMHKDDMSTGQRRGWSLKDLGSAPRPPLDRGTPPGHPFKRRPDSRVATYFRRWKLGRKRMEQKSHVNPRQSYQVKEKRGAENHANFKVGQCNEKSATLRTESFEILHCDSFVRYHGH